MSNATCATCNDNGIVLDRDAGTWDVCPVHCQASKDFEEELRKGEEDIRAGRLHKWSDIRRSIP